MNRRTAAFVALAVVFGALFIRLGFWQLDRLSQRRASNVTLAAKLAERVTVAGTPDDANEIVITGRSHNGSPGVYIVTPIRRPGSDSAVLVNRGWVYAPDAMTVDLSRWRETRTRFTGYRQEMPSRATLPPIKGRSLRELTSQAAQQLVPYPVTGLIVAQDSASERTPARLPLPALDDGPHLSYAIQWFSFATIALVGAGVVVSRARRRDTPGATGA